MRITKVVCAENIIRDTENGQITIYNLFDDISAAAYPLLLPKFSIYFFSQKDPAEVDVQEISLKIYNNEDQLFADTMQVNFKGKSKNRGVIKFNGLAIRASGTLSIKMFDKPEETTLLHQTEIILSVISQAPTFVTK